jgi:putative ABC transport system permease protein
MLSFWEDLGYGVRLLAKNPGTTLAAVLALTLAIGANTAIFSVVNGVLLRPLNYPDPDRLVMVWETEPSKGITEFSVTPPNFQDWLEQQMSFASVAAFRAQPAILTGTTLPERVEMARVSVAMFSVLGAGTRLGRVFASDEDRPGKNRVAVISFGLWQRRFASDPGVLNRVVTMDGSDYQIVGVTSEGFRLLDTASELWIPFTLDAKELQALGKGNGAGGPRSANHTLKVVARLKPEVSVRQSRQEMESIAQGLQRRYADTNEGWGANVVSLQEQFVGNIRATLLVLLGAVVFVLLIACSNVASLLLAQSIARQKEFAVRSALGASRFRIICQLLTEGMVLSFISGVLGVLLAFGGVRALVAFSPGNIPRIEDVRIDGSVLMFTLLVSVLTGLLAGVAPAISASRVRLSQVLKAAGRGNTGGKRTRLLRNALMVFEIAFTVVLLIGAGLMVRSFVRLQSVNPGFSADHILTMKFTLPKVRYDGLRVAQFHQQLLERVQTVPGVRWTGITRDLPLSGSDPSLNFVVEHGPVLSSAQQPRAKFRVVSADYFAAMGIPLVKGRYFLASDSETAPGAAIINETMARRYFPNQDPLGKRLQSGFDDSPWSSIVGVIGDIRHGGLDSEANAEMYFPYHQIPNAMMSFVEGTMTLVVNSTTEASSLTQPIAAQIRSLDPEEAVFRVTTMEELLHRSTAQPLFRTYLLGVFAAVALVLAATGLYGVISFSVSQRSNELGIRSALGAKKIDLLKLVLIEGTGLALIGVLAGVVLAFALSTTVSKLLYGIAAHDPVAFIAVPVILLAVAILASYVPALRATGTDPAAALRYE